MNRTDNRSATYIRSVILLGRTLQTEHREIVDLYRRGASLREIATPLSEEYGIPVKQASDSVQRALAGHNGLFEIPSYLGMLPTDERMEVSKAHESANGVRTVARMRELVKNSGSERPKAGIFSLTLDERVMARKKAMEVQGHTPWKDEEKNFVRDNYLLPQYRRGTLLDCAKLTYDLNERFHPGTDLRKKRTVYLQVKRIEKKKEDK
ncbi:MAG: hypothetical protein ACP5NS_01075 [Candidatus Pacearchaeota archaeon]